MPELPEVESVCRALNEITHAKPKVIKIFKGKKKLRILFPSMIEKKLIGQSLHGIRRRAKYLLFDFDNHTLINHLGMSGSWRLDDNLKMHDHFAIYLNTGQVLVYNDPRRFGLVDITDYNKENLTKWIKHLGPEPFDEVNMTSKFLFELSKKSSTPIKSWIMNQKILVGVGNIYACEALFLAKVHPLKLCNEITIKQYNKILISIRKILHNAISQGGSTIRSYKNFKGEKGGFQASHKVYGRKGENCIKCKTLITSQVITGRNTFWCPSCQK